MVTTRLDWDRGQLPATAGVYLLTLFSLVYRIFAFYTINFKI